MKTFPTLQKGERFDSSKHSESLTADAKKFEADGGYTITRRAHTRPPRKSLTLGLTQVSDETKTLIEAFYNDVNTVEHFEFQNPASQQTMIVRFEEAPTFRYAGKGGLKQWNISIQVKEV